MNTCGARSCGPQHGEPSAARRGTGLPPSAPVRRALASGPSIEGRVAGHGRPGGPAGPGTTIASTVRSENDDDMKSSPPIGVPRGLPNISPGGVAGAPSSPGPRRGPRQSGATARGSSPWPTGHLGPRPDRATTARPARSCRPDDAAAPPRVRPPPAATTSTAPCHHHHRRPPDLRTPSRTRPSCWTTRPDPRRHDGSVAAGRGDGSFAPSSSVPPGRPDPCPWWSSPTGTTASPRPTSPCSTPGPRPGTSWRPPSARASARDLPGTPRARLRRPGPRRLLRHHVPPRRARRAGRTHRDRRGRPLRRGDGGHDHGAQRVVRRSSEGVPRPGGPDPARRPRAVGDKVPRRARCSWRWAPRTSTGTSPCRQRCSTPPGCPKPCSSCPEATTWAPSWHPLRPRRPSGPRPTRFLAMAFAGASRTFPPTQIQDAVDAPGSTPPFSVSVGD